MIKVRFDINVNQPRFIKAVKKKQKRVLFKSGAYARTTLRRSIRPAKKSDRARTVIVGNQAMIVRPFGKVLDAATGKPVTTELAQAARRRYGVRRRKEGRGKPPRRGVTDLLREGMRFNVDLTTETVVAYPLIFGSQPNLVGVKNVPDLLEFGGGEYLGDKLVEYDPHPFVAPSLRKAEKRFAELVEKEQLRP